MSITMRQAEAEVRRGLRCPVCASRWSSVYHTGDRVVGQCLAHGRMRSAKVGTLLARQLKPTIVEWAEAIEAT